MPKINLSDYVINHLGDLGVSDIFVVYGAANGNLIDAFVRTEKTKYVAVMHEQAGGFAAEGFAKTSGKLGVAIATSGPGGMNFVTAAGNCFYDSVPVLFITGQVKQAYMRPDKSIRQIGFQESDMVGVFEPLTKYAKMVETPESIKYELEKAIHIATSGRPGPVLLDLPIDVQKAMIDPDELQGYDTSLSKSYDKEAVRSAARQYLADLRSSTRPAFIVGGGVKNADADSLVREIAEKLNVPCFPTWNALDIICSDYSMYGGRIGTYGGAGRNFGIQNTDLILAVGSRISGRITGGAPSTFIRGAKKYMVDVDEAGLQKTLQQLPFDECILSDAKIFCQIMLEEIEHDIAESGPMPDFSQWVDKVMTWKKKYDTVTEEMFNPSEFVHPYAFARILSEEMSSRDILVGDCGGNIVVLNHAFQTKIGQRYFTNNGNSPMGFSFAGAMGACFAAEEDQNVVCVIGDGGMNMNIQELQTLVNYNVKLKTIILNNHIYGITKAYQKVNFEGRCEACGPVGYNPPDFLKIAEAYNIDTMSIDSGKDYEVVRKQIQEMLDHPGPLVVDVNCHEYHTYEPKVIGWSTPVEDMYPYLEREEFLSNMEIDPMEISLNEDQLVRPVSSNESDP